MNNGGGCTQKNKRLKDNEGAQKKLMFLCSYVYTLKDRRTEEQKIKRTTRGHKKTYVLLFLCQKRKHTQKLMFLCSYVKKRKHTQKLMFFCSYVQKKESPY